MKGETIAEAAKLIDSTNDTITNSIGDEMAQHMREEFNGTWLVMVGEGNVSTSLKRKDNVPYIRFSYDRIMFIVSKEVENTEKLILIYSYLFMI